MRQWLTGSVSKLTNRVTGTSDPAAIASKGGKTMQQFQIETGTSGEVTKVTERDQWQPWTTTKQLQFTEPISRTRTLVVFRSGRWLLRVKIIDVRMHNGYRWQAMK